MLLKQGDRYVLYICIIPASKVLGGILESPSPSVCLSKCLVSATLPLNVWTHTDEPFHSSCIWPEDLHEGGDNPSQKYLKGDNLYCQMMGILLW